MAVQSVTKNLAVFPQDKDMPAASLVAATMMNDFPCNK
jgi:hypothetical protein